MGIAILINIFIVINSCLPGAESSSESGWVSKIFASFINFFKHGAINDSNMADFDGSIRKLVGHFGLFLVAGVFNALSLKYIYLDKYKDKLLYFDFLFIYGLFLAGLTEIIQKYVPNRSGEFKDVMIDFSGYFIGIYLVLLIMFLKEHHRHKAETK